jgi:hypothetical protein
MRSSLIQPRESPKMDVIFNALEDGWPNAKRNRHHADLFFVWGLIGNNAEFLRKMNTMFVDMPYFNRWLPGQDLNDSNWRMCHGNVHNNTKLDVTIDRFESFGVKVKPWQTDTEHILVCPSSETMTQYMHNMSAGEWAASVKKMLTAYTNRPIRIRQKPRKNGTSGPAAADVSIEDDLIGCHAVVTSGSLTAIDALVAGVPVFTTTQKHCPAAWCANTDMSKMNHPTLFDREELFANLAHKQYSIEEMRNGFCYENLRRLHDNQGW